MAVFTVLMFVVIFGMGAFTIDAGNWYMTSQENQRAADAAALAGVTFMPGDFATASAAALDMASRNGLAAGSDVSVTPSPVAGQNSRLQVTVAKTVKNAFGGLFGLGTTTISRTSVAAFTGPVPMGSPCNEFGNDPVPGSNKSSNCASVGQFWANVGSSKADKGSGDAYQNGVCSNAAYDACAGGKNTEYDANGYFYTLTVKTDMPSLTVQAFDPAFVSVGDTCGTNVGTGATAIVHAKNSLVYRSSTNAYRTGESDASTSRYAAGSSSAFCTGDPLFGTASTPPDTTFTVRKAVSTTYPWDPTSYAPVGGTSCAAKTFNGFSGDLYPKLNQWTQAETSAGSGTYAPVLTNGNRTTSTAYNAEIAAEFRQWVPICTMTNVTKGTYMIQVQTNGPDDTPDGNGHNRFALRAFGSSATDNGNIAVAGYAKMAVYANLPSATTQFFLAQVPPTAKGQILNIRLFDVGDSQNTGNITVLPPTDSGLTQFPTCIGTGPRSGMLANCTIQTNSTSFQGKWQTISIPLPSTYTCSTTTATGCWVKLQFAYGSGNQPSDTTSWQASIEGDPVRLVK
jgi:hypothetical protein